MMTLEILQTIAFLCSLSGSTPLTSTEKVCVVKFHQCIIEKQKEARPIEDIIIDCLENKER